MTAALIIIDMQKSLLWDETWQPERVLAQVVALEQAARRAGVPIVYVTDSRVEPDGTLVGELSPSAGDAHIVKHYCDAFLETGLRATLAEHGIGRLVVCGLHTDFCVDTTCRRAAALGYQVTLVSDAHSTFDRDYLSAEKVIEHHNQILSDFPAGDGRVTVAGSDQIVFG